MSSRSTGNAISLSVDTLDAMLQNISINLAQLGKRIEALEQSQRDGNAGKNMETSTTAEEAANEKPNGEAQSDKMSNETDLHSLVEFRKEIYIKDKESRTLEWVSDLKLQESSSSQQKSFRYDSHDSGKLTFSVYRSASLYNKMLQLCPPSNDRQIKLTEDRLEIADVFPLLHCRPALMKYQENLRSGPQNDKVRNELKELEVLNKLYDREGHLLYAKRDYTQLHDKKTIDFHHLKGLFHKDQLVVFRELRDEWAIARVSMLSLVDDPHDKKAALELECKAIDFDGKRFRSHIYRRTIPRFSGTRKITELSVYPLDYHDEKDSLVQKSIESGSRWKKLHERLTTEDKQPKSTVMQYVGYCETFCKDEDEADKKGSLGAEIAGRVIVDPTKFTERLIQFVQDNEDPFGIDESFAGEDENDPLVLCPEKVLVYSLSDNQWYYVAMSRLYDPTWLENAWELLVKPSSPPSANLIERIRDLAEAHQSTKENDKSVDNFRGKGKGLTFLLHGSPGVGKTMLAECLSEEHKRPLYRVNFGMFIDDWQWESNVEQIFRQAHFWDAILLIDEAEVILAERTQESMMQCAWVAVVLRKIEHFEGVLFLTTNQIHMIDPAFISRVSIGMKYPDFDSETRFHLWEKVLNSLPESNQAHWIVEDEKKLRGWAARHLNGRQIRNVIRSAQLLAKPPMTGRLTYADIDKCLQDVMDFMDMIKVEKKNVEMNYMSQWS